jgi:hypothetical protein
MTLRTFIRVNVAFRSGTQPAGRIVVPEIGNRRQSSHGRWVVAV